jgi:thiol-disulfide isomerase/thioredoxin
MARAPRWILGALFVGLVGLIIYSISSATVDAFHSESGVPLELLNPQYVGQKQTEDFSLPDRTGRIHKLSELEGRPVLLNFWSSDCPPCLEELPSLIGLDKIARERGTFSVVTVTIDDDWDAVKRFFSKGPDPELLILFDPERVVVEQQFGTHKFPETFLLDRQGTIRARFDGQRNWSNPVVLNLIEVF